MPTIQVEGLGSVEIAGAKPTPDEEAAIAEALSIPVGGPAAASPVAGIGKDMALSGATGVAKGVVSLPTMAGDLMRLGDQGLDWVLSKMVGVEPGSVPARRQAMDQASNGFAIPDPFDLINGENARRAVGDAIGGWRKPQTNPGKFAETVGEFIPGALAFGPTRSVPEALGTAARYGVAPGIASEAAGQATEGTAAEPFARGGAAMVTGGAAAILARPGTQGQIVGNAMRGMDRDQINRVGKLMREAVEAGSPITLPEAVQAVTNGATTLGDLQRVVEGSRRGGAVMKEFYSQRGPNNEAMIRRGMDEVGPLSDTPSAVEAGVQRGATAELQAAEQARTAAVNPHYTAAAADNVPTKIIDDLLGRIDAEIAADKTGILAKSLREVRDILTASPGSPGTAAQRIPRTTPAGKTIYEHVPGTAPTPREPITDIENLDRARKYLRDKIDLPPFAAEATPKEAAGNVGDILKSLRGDMEAASAQFGKGREVYEQLSKNVVDPLIQSKTGQLAAAERFPAQAKVLFGGTPGSQKEVFDAVHAVARTEPQAARDLVRMYLEDAFNRTSKVIGEQPQWSGARYRAALESNPQQAENLKMAMLALPEGNQAYAAMRRVLDVLEAQGWRKPQGSATEFNRQVAQDLADPSGIANAATMVGSPGRWTTAVRDAYQRFRFGQNTEQLARLFTSPEAVREAAGLANLGPGSPEAVRIVGRLLELGTVGHGSPH